jgi:hypothetical protein
MTDHWASNPDRLLLATPAMDGDTRDLARRVRMADNQRIRAYRAGTNLRRSWEAGDPGRGGKPWRPFCRELWEQGREDARLWQHEDRQERERVAREKFERAEARARRKRRKTRATRVYRIVKPVAPRTARRLRRWLS